MKKLNETKMKTCLKEIEYHVKHINARILSTYKLMRGDDRDCHEIQECVNKLWKIMEEEK